MTQALFYPWIDVRNEEWLKTSLLYWDSVRTIVPESVECPYSTNTGRALQDAGFLMPLRVHSGMYEIEELAGDVLAYLGTDEGAELLIASPGGRRHDIHSDKLPYELGRLGHIHPEKLPYEIRQLLHEISVPSERRQDWLQVDEKFANYYMTLLASRLAERVGARLLTALPAADRLAVAARFDAKMTGMIPWEINTNRRHWREYEAFGQRRSMPRHLAPGMLANLVIERIGVSLDTPIERLIEFRERHQDELAQFRTKVEQLASSIGEDLPIEALRERVSMLYSNEVVPAIGNLKAALEGRRIRWIGDGLLKVSFLSVGSSSMLVAAGLEIPTALLAGAGLSLVAAGAMYNVDKRESLRTNPFAYLLSLENELA